MNEASPSPVRCAIYTRKSTEEGLDQAFNSLHAQREACEAFVLSQAGEGWRVLPTIYDDGGYSGGNLERPALKRLLADIDTGLVDTVVVYKIDRLTRSLADFAKIVERLDGGNASFVSVTQAFNTTTSMGRLTLNVLLSFAQFEREVTGERIRDKIAASKAKGMWMGGNLPLGYDAPVDPTTRALVVNPAEAETVRAIFRRYLDLRSVHALRDWLAAEGIRPKPSGRARQCGSVEFGRGALFHLLKNRVYLGEITHKGCSHPGRHAAIVDAETFEAVQVLLKSQANAHRGRPLRAAQSLLRGRVFDAQGRPMSPAFSRGKGGRPYRYYVSTDVQQGRQPAGDLKRVSAPILEDIVHRLVHRLAGSANLTWTEAAPLIRRVDVFAEALQVSLEVNQRAGLAPTAIRARLEQSESLAVADDMVIVHLPVRAKVRGGRTWLLGPGGQCPVTPTMLNRSLVRALKAAHAVMREAAISPEASSEQLLGAVSPANAYDRKLSLLGFLAPDIQRAILEGRQPRALTLAQLTRDDLPLSWVEQRRVLGF